MRFLADENFPKPLVTKITRLGHSVKSVQQQKLVGSSDETVSGIATREKRIIITFDKDFLKKKLPGLTVVVFDFPKTTTSEIANLITTFLNSLSQKQLKGGVFRFNKNNLQEVGV